MVPGRYIYFFERDDAVTESFIFNTFYHFSYYIVLYAIPEKLGFLCHFNVDVFYF